MAVRWPLLLASLFLISCSRDDAAAGRNADRDPAVSDALNDPLMADPDLVNQNQGGAALTGGGPASAEIPPIRHSQDEIDAAKAAAQGIAGGKIAPAPGPSDTLKSSRLARAVTAPAVADALGIGARGCSVRLGYSALWAAKLTAPFEVYPRGHLGEATGSDEAGCRLRVVSFRTPVAVGDVIAFYAARTKAAGLPVRRTREDTDDILQGSKGGAAYAVVGRERDDKLSEITIVTNGM
ncbi:MAG: hypothetical protein KGM49_14250 [Sphingomonadales bacterium]|nr:hypothetical protein [Sphingomonadales bacterium]